MTRRIDVIDKTLSPPLRIINHRNFTSINRHLDAMLALLTRLWPPSSAGIVSAGSAAAAAAAAAVPAGAQKATFAAGCFWGPEHMFREEFGGRGLYDARVGYIGGGAERPSYRAVCSGRTGRELPAAKRPG
jgi:hypothetical protein